MAPVAAGFITDSQGWRWVWWWIAIFFGVQSLLMFFGFEESKYNSTEIVEGRRQSAVFDQGAPILVAGNKKKAVVVPLADALDSEKQGEDLEHRRTLSLVQVDPTIKRKTYREMLKLFSPSPGPFSHFFRHAWQPFVILFTIPGVAYCS